MSKLCLLICRRNESLCCTQFSSKSEDVQGRLTSLGALSFTSDTSYLSRHLSFSFLISGRIESFVLLKILVAVTESLFP